jgi:hypothetical protein
MRYQLYGVIHVYVVPGNEERKRPEVLFPTAVQIMSRRRFPHHIHLRLAQEGPKKPRGYFGKSHLNPLACSKRTQATPGFRFPLPNGVVFSPSIRICMVLEKNPKKLQVSIFQCHVQCTPDPAVPSIRICRA